RGLLRCKKCGTAMSHTFCGKNESNYYRYYRCTNAIKNGHDVCPVGSLPAGEMERVVVEEVRGLTKDKALLAQVLADTYAAIESQVAEIRRERDALCRERVRNHKELQQLAASGTPATNAIARIAELHERLAVADQRISGLEARVAELEAQTVTPEDARAAFADFDEFWKNLIPREQARLLKLLISTVEYDGEAGTVSVTFRPTSIRSLIDCKLEDAA
ncbi:MAG: recombinase zinc beta ribbon domain-containing protein, partial [Phycisphaerae bacterium]|nr:recombinase zinc beta ribbon domain-containing protein [Phycisphaerae bacterium]